MTRGTVGLLTVCFLSGIFSACSAPPEDSSALVLVSVGQIPAATTTLMAEVRISETQFERAPSFDINPADLPAGNRYSFGLRIHDKLSGQVQVSVAALKVTGDKRCLLGTVSGTVPLVEDAQPTLSLDLIPDPQSGQFACNADVPIAQRASQDLLDGRARLAVDGFGFVPGAQVLIDGEPQDFVVNPSPLRLLTDLPIVTAPSGARPVRVEVRLPSGAISNAVDFVASEPWFDTPTAPFYRASVASGVTVYTGGATGDFNGDKRLDLAVSGYVYNGGKRGSGFVDIFLNTGRGLSKQRITSPVWTDTALADPANVTANAVAATNYRLRTSRDLIVAVSDTVNGKGGFLVLHNDGKGNFTPSTIYLLDSNYPNPTAMAHVDVNPKVDFLLHPDLVLLNTGADGTATLSVFLADANGNLSNSVYYAVGIGTNPSGFTAADLNKDGQQDFVVIATNASDSSKPQVHAILNYGDGKIYPSFADTLMNSDIDGLGGAVVAADLLSDTNMYLVASSYALPLSPERSVVVLRNRDTLSMHPSGAPANPPAEPAIQLLPQRYAAGPKPASLAVLDADHDAGLDIAAVLSGSGHEPSRLVILRNRLAMSDDEDLFPAGPGKTDSLPTFTLFGESGDAHLIADDINGDTFLDLMVIVLGDGETGIPGSVWFFRSL